MLRAAVTVTVDILLMYILGIQMYRGIKTSGSPSRRQGEEARLVAIVVPTARDANFV